MIARHPLFAPVLVVVAAGAWGVYWIPQRALESADLMEGWSTLVQYVVPVILLAPIALWRVAHQRPSGFGHPAFGLLFGGGIVCYANSFLLTDVAHTLLLFYLTPVWGTVLEAVVLRRRITPLRVGTVLLALSGIWVVFSQAGGWPIPRNVGDWLALAGGLGVAAGVTIGARSPPPGVFAPLFAFSLYGTPVAGLCCLLFADALGPPPTGATVLMLLPWVGLLAVVFLIPGNTALTWSSTKVAPGVFGILILSEIVVGLASAALWAGEPFGWREALGGTMVVIAGLLESAWPLIRRRRALR